jgi:hypothetical protein
MRWAGDAGQVCYVLVRRPPISGPSNRGVFSFRISRFVLGGSHGDPNFGAIHTFLLGRGRKTADRGAKILERVFLKFGLLQVLEIAQNRQSFLWKSLDKTGRYLEMFGEKAWRLCKPPRGCPGRDGMWPRSPSAGRRRAKACHKALAERDAADHTSGSRRPTLQEAFCSSPAPPVRVDAPARPR